MPPKASCRPRSSPTSRSGSRCGARRPAQSSKAAGGHKEIDIEEGRKFWAFQPPQDAGRAAGEGRRLAAERHRSLHPRRSWRQKGLTPVADADRATLIRRALLRPDRPAADAGGDRRVRQRRARRDAFAKVVDRLLASPHYGERWGRHWLDVARYAESTGGGRSLLVQGRLALSRLRHRRVQQRQAVRPVRQRADRRRPAARADARGTRLAARSPPAFLAARPDATTSAQDKPILRDGHHRRAARHDRPGVPRA